MSDEFQFPKVHITEVYEEGGSLYEKAKTSPVCDFCFDTRVMWDYATERFFIDEIGFGSDEGWALCDVCADLVERGIGAELCARVLRSWAALGRKIDGRAIDEVGMIVQGFFDHRRPGRVAFG